MFDLRDPDYVPPHLRRPYGDGDGDGGGSGDAGLRGGQPLSPGGGAGADSPEVGEGGGPGADGVGNVVALFPRRPELEAAAVAGAAAAVAGDRVMRPAPAMATSQWAPTWAACVAALEVLEELGLAEPGPDGVLRLLPPLAGAEPGRQMRLVVVGAMGGAMAREGDGLGVAGGAGTPPVTGRSVFVPSRGEDAEVGVGSVGGRPAVYPFAVMEVGGSFDVLAGPDQPKFNSLRVYCATKSRELGRKFRCTRLQSGAFRVKREG